MKIIKRLLAVIFTVAVLSAVSVTAWADSIADTAVAIKNGDEIATKLYYRGDDISDYKIDVMNSGEMEIDITSYMNACIIYVYDSNGNEIKPSTYESMSGEIDDWKILFWNETVERYCGKIIYPVEAGSYFIRLKRPYYGNEGNGNVEFIVTAPVSLASPAATDGSILSTIKSMLVYFTVDIPKGSTLQLGAITPNLSVPISWISHNTNVATVTSNGEITAKAKGSAYIAIRFGPNVRIVQVNVV